MEAGETKNAVFIVAKKELKLLFKSKRRIGLLAMIPLIIILIGIISAITANVAIESETATVNVWVRNESPSNYTATLISSYETIEHTEFTPVNESLDQLINAEKFHVIVDFPANFTSAIEQKNLTAVIIWYNNNSSRYQDVAIQIAQMTSVFEQQLIVTDNPGVVFDRVNPALKELPKDQDQGGISEEMANTLFILPVYVIFFVVIPPISLVMISVTIEREQRTLETLFLQPVTRRSIILGKITYGLGLILTVLVLDLIAAGIDFLIITSFIDLDTNGIFQDILNEFVDLIGFDVILYFIVAVILISVNTIGLSVMLSLLAKDEKEANMVSGLLPLLIFGMLGLVFIVPFNDLSVVVQSLVSSFPVVGVLIGLYLCTVAGSIVLPAWISIFAQIGWAIVIILFTARLSEAESILELSWSKSLSELRRMIFRR